MRAAVTAIIVASIASVSCGIGNAQQQRTQVGEEGPLQRTVFACQDWDEFKRIDSFIAQHDKDAFNAALSRAMMLGDCTIFKKGETAFITDAGFTSVKLRRRGETAGYWTIREAMDPPAKNQDENQK